MSNHNGIRMVARIDATMASLLIKDIPVTLHQRLRREARRCHRSMNQQVIAMLEQDLETAVPLELPRPVVGAKPLTPGVLTRGVREGRA